ncbi:MAG: D-sedoheptulose-7-phosphate isomerase [Chthoniobacterales bacterium]
MAASHLSHLFGRYPQLAPCEADLQSAVDLLTAAFRAGNKLLICGNGGSAADSEHIVGELMKGFLQPRPLTAADRDRLTAAAGEAGTGIAQQLQGALPAISLVSALSLNTAIANDTDAAVVFAQQVYGLGKPGDVLLGISTSGNSKNVVNATIVANAFGLKTIALTGQNGGRLAELANRAIRVPAVKVPEIQELHLPVYHWLCIELEARFYGDSLA